MDSESFLSCVADAIECKQMWSSSSSSSSSSVNTCPPRRSRCVMKRNCDMSEPKRSFSLNEYRKHSDSMDFFIFSSCRVRTSDRRWRSDRLIKAHKAQERKSFPSPGAFCLFLRDAFMELIIISVSTLEYEPGSLCIFLTFWGENGCHINISVSVFNQSYKVPLDFSSLILYFHMIIFSKKRTQHIWTL